MSRLWIPFVLAALCCAGSIRAGAAAQEQLKTQYDEACKTLKEDDEAAQQRLAQWCDTNKLKSEAEKHWGAYYTVVIRKKRAELEKKPTRAAYVSLVDFCTRSNLRSQADEFSRELLLFDFRDQKAKLKAGDAKALLALAKSSAKNGLTEQSTETLREIIALEADHAEARAELGYFKIDGKWQTEEELGQKFVAAPAAERDALFSAWQKAGFKNTRAELDKYVAWSGAPKGHLRDLKVPGYSQPTAWYHLNVPDEYEAFKPALPLIIFLHGGGTGSGSANDIVAYGDVLVSMSGCIGIFPNHINDWWATPVETNYLMTIIGEVLKSYRVDMRRIYLMGGSMGGNGTWAIGTQYSEMFAGIEPAAAYWEPGLGLPMKNLLAKPVYILHGVNDKVVQVECSRRASDVLKKQGTNYIYAELDCEHQCPQEEYEKGLKWLRQYSNKQTFRFDDMLARAKKNLGGKK